VERKASVSKVICFAGTTIMLVPLAQFVTVSDTGVVS
jgi:hypothetical protein